MGAIAILSALLCLGHVHAVRVRFIGPQPTAEERAEIESVFAALAVAAARHKHDLLRIAKPPRTIRVCLVRDGDQIVRVSRYWGWAFVPRWRRTVQQKDPVRPD